MKLSDETVSVLKNYSTINQNLMIKSGQALTTMSAMKNIVAKSTVAENFERDIAIYDLNEFLASLSIFKSPVLEFEEQYLTIKEEDQPHKKLTYFYSDPSVIVSPTKDVNMPEADVNFTLTQSTLEQLTKMAAILKAPDLALVGTQGGDITLKVCDKKNDTSNNFDIVVGEGATADYTFYFKVENMKMLPGDYDVSVSSKSISHFKNKKLPIEYWIALEPDSEF